MQSAIKSIITKLNEYGTTAILKKVGHPLKLTDWSKKHQRSTEPPKVTLNKLQRSTVEMDVSVHKPYTTQGGALWKKTCLNSIWQTLQNTFYLLAITVCGTNPTLPITLHFHGKAWWWQHYAVYMFSQSTVSYLTT